MTRLLIIEDDLVDQMAIIRKLQQDFSKLTIHTADSIAAAISQLEQHAFDIIISDYHFPDGSFFDLPINPESLPVILISGEEIAGEIAAPEMKVRKVLEKDYQLIYLEQLSKLVGSLLNKTPAKRPAVAPVQSGKASVNISLEKLMATFGHDQQIVKEIIQTFLKESAVNINRLQLALAEERFSDMSKAAHQLKSQYLLMGLSRLQQLSTTIEKLAPLQTETLETVLEELAISNRKACRSLEEYLISLS